MRDAEYFAGSDGEEDTAWCVVFVRQMAAQLVELDGTLLPGVGVPHLEGRGEACAPILDFSVFVVSWNSVCCGLLWVATLQSLFVGLAKIVQLCGGSSGGFHGVEGACCR